jgi:hypothetical protein
VDGWLIGLIALCIVGVAVIAYGALWDRHRYRKAVSAMLNPPARNIPQLPANATRPDYMTQRQARRRPARHAPDGPGADTSSDETSDTDLGVASRAELTRQLADPTTVVIPAGYASDDFVTDTASGQAILERPLVLVSAQPIMAIRELIGPLEHVLAARAPIVIAAPSMPGDVLETLAINRIQQRLAVVVVLSSDPSPIDAICSATEAHLTGRIDLQAGYLTGADLGRCHRWVSNSDRSYIITAPDNASPGVVQP